MKYFESSSAMASDDEKKDSLFDTNDKGL